jgi:hypothetical protein
MYLVAECNTWLASDVMVFGVSARGGVVSGVLPEESTDEVSNATSIDARLALAPREWAVLPCSILFVGIGVSGKYDGGGGGILSESPDANIGRCCWLK